MVREPEDPGPSRPAERTPERSPERPPEPPRTSRQTPLFLHRETYRRRRVMDAARLLPFVGAALLLLPMLWSDTHSTATGGIYVLLAWLALIVCGGLMAHKLSEPLRKDAPKGPGNGTGTGQGEAEP